MKFVTTTPVGTEGNNITYATEKRCAESLNLSDEWTVNFDWAQILFSDVQYEVNRKKKEVNVTYNQCLSYWWPQVKKGIEKETKKATPAKK